MKLRSPSLLARTAILLGSTSLLSGCFLVPGQFESEMEINADGTFSYSYDGDIHFLGLTQLAEMGQGFGSGSSVDLDAPCYTYSWEKEEGADATAEAAAEAVEEAAEKAEEATELQEESTSGEDDVVLAPAPPVVIATESDDAWDEPKERDCTEEELQDRRDRAERKQKRDERTARQMAALFGGVDPSDPKAGEKIAEKLERQKGWDKVEHIGDGKFDVEFAITSRIEHDFAFPMMEGMTAAQPFLYAYRRANAVRIEAPGLAISQNALDFGGSSMGGLNLIKFATTIAASEDDKIDEDDFAFLFDVGGTFTLTTNSEILANNTDEGFERLSDGRRKLVWEVDSETKDAPMALIELP